jgi:hypothetical protein
MDQMIEKVIFDQESQRLDQESEKIQQVFAEPTDEQYDKVIVDHLDPDRFIVTIRFLPKNKKMKNA